MTIANPVLLHVLDANYEVRPIRLTGNGLPLSLTAWDRYDAVQEWTIGTVSSSGDNTALAAPGSGRQYIVAKLQVQNQGSDPVMVTIKWGSREVWKFYLFDAGAVGRLDFQVPDHMEGRDNQPLILNLSAAVAVGYCVQWYAIPVT